MLFMNLAHAFLLGCLFLVRYAFTTSRAYRVNYFSVRAEGGKTLPLSETSPPRNELIEPDEVKLDSTQTKVKRLVMTRDDYRCQVSGMLDKNSVIRGTISHSAGQRVVSTVAAHIIPLPVILSPQVCAQVKYTYQSSILNCNQVRVDFSLESVQWRRFG